ncbi:LamB/YcsF family protein [Microvirga roseola]|uniref:LamB/YcsF family protein n=1 Tax=Microvirga roseola TaxID=2883126 RepID=UPI001E5B0519|nr:5-oxoprolinase subunit PxpA [Microvirga roseola]
MKVDLNCDMGEGFGPWPMGDDDAMLDIVSSANIACGFHAGDPSIMFRTAETARRKGVAIGAHPGFDDLHGFGRRMIRGDSPAEIERMIAYQIGAMQAVASLAGHRVTYVKVHGALNNMANEDEDLALAIARAIKGVDVSLINVCMPGLLMEKASGKLGLQVAREIFADRTYEDNGTLTSRKKPGSVLHDAEFAAERMLRAVQDKAVTTVSGKRIPVEIDTICVHGDEPSAVAMARTVRAKLEANGISIAPFSGS